MNLAVLHDVGQPRYQADSKKKSIHEIIKLEEILSDRGTRAKDNMMEDDHAWSPRDLTNGHPIGAIGRERKLGRSRWIWLSIRRIEDVLRCRQPASGGSAG
nr:hypothetical protein CFP56_32462 [Quercus suber]